MAKRLHNLVTCDGGGGGVVVMDADASLDPRLLHLTFI